MKLATEWVYNTQLYPGLHQKQRGQQGVGADSAPLLHSCETPSRVLHPALEPSAHERYGPVGAVLEEGHKNDQRAGAPPLWGKAEGVGAVQPGEEKAAGRPYWGLSVLKGGLQETWRRTFTRGCSDRTRGSGFKLKEGRFRVKVRKKFFTMRVVKH